jgi:uncharacterized membrane protein YbaN (DUF454 family)
MRFVGWKVLAIVFVVLGVVAVVLPVVPAVPFLLLAAAAASRGWPWLDRRLTAHSRYGPLIARWRQRRAVPRAVKQFAATGMVASSLGFWFTPAPLWLRLAVPSAMAAVMWWLWNRPED